MTYKIYDNNSTEWVLLIHGLGGSIRTWKYQIEDLHDYNVIAVDLEGHGGSVFEKRKRLLTRSASDINSILEKENIHKVNVIALSLGTLVAMEFAGFVLNMGLGYKTLLALVEGIKYIVPKKFFYPMFANIMMPHKNHKKSRDFFIRESVKMKSAAFRRWLSELFRTQFKLNEYVNVIKESNVPVFFITGNEDYFFVNSVKRAHRKLSEASFSFIDKCGHVCSIEKYHEFNDLVLDYLNGLKKPENTKTITA